MRYTAALYLSLSLTLYLVPQAGAQTSDPFEPLIAEAVRNNLSIRQQRLSDDKSEMAVREARGMYLPSVSLDARYSEIDGGLSFPGVGSYPFAQETRMRFAQPIFQPGVLANYQIHTSLRGLEGARLRSATRALAADVQLAYVNHARAQRVVDLYTNTLDVVKEAVRVNERLLANGKITPASLHRAIADRSEIEQHIAEAERQRNAARRYFNYLLGRTSESPVDVFPDSLFRTSADQPVEAVIARAMQAREEIEQADWGIKASEAQAKLARSSFLPGVSLVVDYGVQGQDYRFDSEHDNAMASLVLSWNVFNGGQDNARRQQAMIDMERGEIGKKQAQQQIELQVRQAYDGVAVSKKAIDAAQDRVNAARRSFELMHRRYMEGVASQLEFVDARTSLTSAELNFILTKYQYITNFIELERVGALREIVP